MLKGREVTVDFPRLPIDPQRMAKLKCYQALEKIKAVIRDDSLSDEECFMKIEEIICVLEDLGSGGSGRHDFG